MKGATVRHTKTKHTAECLARPKKTHAVSLRSGEGKIRYCTHCGVYMRTDFLVCPCCDSRMRASPRFSSRKGYGGIEKPRVR